jgi:flagellar motor switch protein FliM
MPRKKTEYRERSLQASAKRINKALAKIAKKRIETSNILASIVGEVLVINGDNYKIIQRTVKGKKYYNVQGKSGGKNVSVSLSEDINSVDEIIDKVKVKKQKFIK